MKDKIIAAIAAYLDEATTTRTERFENFLLEFKAPITGNYKEYLEKLAEEIAAAISPLVEAGDLDWDSAPEWAEWKARDKYGAINYFEVEPTAGEEEWYYGGKHEQCGEIPYWTNTLERRPK